MSPSKKALAEKEREQAKTRTRIAGTALLLVTLFGAGLYLLTRGGASAGKAGATSYDIGSPGVGEQAPPISLRSSKGGSFDLAKARSNGPVLLYFQEGLTCQPCWDQIKAIEDDAAKYHTLKITQIVSITSDPLDQITQKASDDGLTIPILSDPGLKVSKTYNAQEFGMMNGSRDGHTFVLVNPDGSIRWRADYGGPPRFTMFVDDATLLAEIRKASTGAGA